MTSAAAIPLRLWLTPARIIELIRQAGDETEKLLRLEDVYVEHVFSKWAELWPRAEAAIVASGSAGNLDAGLAAAGRIYGPGWWTDDEHVLIVETLARSFANGQSEVLAEARSRGAVVRAYPGDVVGIPVTEIFQAELDIAMSVVDQEAAEWLAADSMFWVRDVWDNQLGEDIANAALVTIEQGGGRVELAERLSKRLAIYGESQAYWRVVASASLVRARSFGSVSGFEAAGVTTYSWNAVQDERTTAICNHLHGMVFTLGDAQATRDAVMAAETPDDVKDAAPWLPEAQIIASDAPTLASLGVTAPPAHGNCRSILLVEDFGDFDLS